eukprot:4675596-Pleurochrysis_carterae.AAC.2
MHRLHARKRSILAPVLAAVEIGQVALVATVEDKLDHHVALSPVWRLVAVVEIEGALRVLLCSGGLHGAAPVLSACRLGRRVCRGSTACVRAHAPAHGTALGSV